MSVMMEAEILPLKVSLFLLGEIKGRKWDRNKISTIFIQRASRCYYINAYIFNMVGPSERWSPDLWQCRGHVLPIEIQWTSLHFSPYTNWFLNILPLWFMWSRIKTSLMGPLWELAALDRIQIFIMTAANPKQKFSSVKRNMQNMLILPLEWRRSGVWWRLLCFCLGG